MNEVRENRLLARWAELLPRHPGQVGAIQDADAELVPLDDDMLLALTVDSLSEEIEAGLYTAAVAGRVVVAACLSDLAAVGAQPTGLLLSVTLPRTGPDATQAAVAEGAGEACREAGVFVLGGDTGEGDRLQLTAVGAGVVPAPAVLCRRGCAGGDRIYATGPLGSGSALAASVLLGIVPPESDYRPPVRTRAGVALRGVASACIDTSDGLVAALDQLARLNDLAFRITAPLHRLLHPVAREMVRSGKVSPFSMLAGHHGEYELVFTVPEDRTPALSRAAADGRFTPVEIGRVEEGTGLWIGEVAVDGARIRNLLHECHGDIAAYAAGLAAEAPP